VHFRLRPIGRDAAERIVAWRYPPPYDFYNIDASVLPALLAPANAYYVASGDDGDIVGFSCFGPDARVPGGDYDDTAVDVGIGLRPDLTGQGLGLSFLESVLGLAEQEHGATRFRATIAAFNARSLLVAERAGFVPTSAFTTASGVDFVQLIRD
jgi:RimJ/RimL family protein N-acetyltransferase